MDLAFDKLFYSEGEMIGGVDESGVSDIAGPLVAACVVLPKIDMRRDDLRILEIGESKTVHRKWLKTQAEVIWQTAMAVGIGEVSAAEFDFLSRRNATALAMFRAVTATKSTTKKSPLRPDFLVVDGDYPVPIQIRQAVCRKGDAKSLCVAAASIIAKVYRDDVMMKLHERYPFYDWANNKGFPNEAHFRGIDQHGIQPGVHRVRKWPFQTTKGVKEDHVRWRKRRLLWRLRTVEKHCREIGDAEWTSKPPLWTPSPNSKLRLNEEETSGTTTNP